MINGHPLNIERLDVVPDTLTHHTLNRLRKSGVTHGLVTGNDLNIRKGRTFILVDTSISQWHRPKSMTGKNKAIAYVKKKIKINKYISKLI